jgi:glycosyltransferase involved in cell wall biosynthesis
MKIAMLVPDNRDEFRRYSDPEPYFGPAPTALLEGLAGISECEIHIVCCTQKPLRSPEKLAENIFYYSLIVPKWGWLRGGYLGCVRAVRKKLREISPDVVHGQGTERYCALAAVRSGFPNVVTIHGIMRRLAKISEARPFSFPWLAARLEGFVLPRTGGVLCNSVHTRREVSDLARRTWLVPNALQEKFFMPARVEANPGVPVLLNIGVIAPNKAQNLVLDIGARLHERKYQFMLHFVGRSYGETAYGMEFQKKVMEAEKKGYAKYLGEKSAGELIDIMDGASALIHLPMEESFGLVVAEALARNLKLFGARIGGIVDIAKDVEGAELFDRDDSSLLSEAIRRWLGEGHSKMPSAAKTMRERYHPSIVAEKHVEIYLEILRMNRLTRGGEGENIVATSNPFG